MRNHEKLLLAGPGAVIIAVLAAHLCARALAEWPNSSLLWYLNLQIWRPFRYGIDLLPGDGFTQAVWIAAPLLALTGVGLALRNKLPLAIAAHLSLFYSTLILYCSGIRWALESSLAVAAGAESWADPNLFVAAILLLSLMSSAASHWQYWREMRLTALKPAN
jgi:hypothetical protein